MTARPRYSPHHSGLYQGSVTHRRFSPRKNSFTYQIAMLGIDLDELDGVINQHWLLGKHWFNPIRFFEKDYLKNDPGTLRQRIENKVAKLGGDWDGSRVLMLVQCRCLGIYFSPINLYYCFEQSGDCKYMLAEVSNTPWNQRHYYLVDMQSSALTPKEFHVSPFMTLDMKYRWRLTTPGQKIKVNIDNIGLNRIDSHSTDLSNTNLKNNKLFDVAMRLDKTKITTIALGKGWLTLPFSIIKVLCLIYWQALKLVAKRIPFIPYQKHGE
ncbi:DUF1365 domain-containing protein [Moritella marina ATCC 15381]|uniref:DUF1365 domain-containing protein n=1 Tax=Moritella marina ATCC 15381 TaxID=1202962 RepID=A0A5J6WJH7_MORMI|nr:DUF1365 domain-containing protein [Moritella marina]QFI36945.1 DUF1365 domain-containing protein [Moritella marina ATCC 15381]